MSEYRDYRRDHPGPLSVRSFEFWRKNGGEDLPSFQWKKKDLKKVTKNNQNKIKHIKFIKMKFKI